LDMCKKLYDEKSFHNDSSKLKNVKSILMKHMESVEKGTERAQDIMNSEIEEMMDPEFAQEKYDCEMEGYEEHSDFLFKDPSELEQSESQKQTFRAVDLYDVETLDSLTRSLNEDQRAVLDLGVNFARSVVKSTNTNGATIEPELVVVQGGAV